VFYLRHLVQHPLDIVIEAVFNYKNGAFRVVDTKGDVVVSQQVIDGKIDCPDLGATQPSQDMMVGVMGQDGYTIVLFYSQASEGVGGLVALIFQLAVSQAHVVEHQGLFVRIVLTGPADHIGNDPPVDPVVSAHDEIDVFLTDRAVPKFFLFREWFIGHGVPLHIE